VHSMNTPLQRTIVITGGGRGLGRSLALRFGAARERVAVTYRTDRNGAESTADEICRHGGEALALALDVRDRSAVEQAVAAVLARWGGIDILVNNAGIAQDALAVRMTEQAWDDVLATDLSGPFRCTRAVAGPMMRQRHGHILNVASITGLQGREGQVNYSAAKAGLIGLTKAAARELGPYDVKVNAVLPGYLETAMGRTVSDAVRERVQEENTLGRVNDPEEVAEFVYRLSLLRNVSGQVFNLDSRIL